MVHVVLNLTVR